MRATVKHSLAVALWGQKTMTTLGSLFSGGGGFELAGAYADGVVQTLSCKMGTGGNNAPMVLAAIEGNGARPSHLGDGYSENDISYTLNTVERHAVAYEHNPVQIGYRIRRLTPLECARLQGFPDWWARGLETPEPTFEEIEWWLEVFETHRLATDPEKKPKTASQVRKWLQNPRSDSAEYRMWGNSIAIPCAYTVLAGISEQMGRDSK